LIFGVCTLPSAPAEELVRRWRLLDGMPAIETIWLPDQLMPRPGLRWLEAWTLLGALARETARVRIGPLVSPLTLRNPAVLARAAVTLDELSDGRAELGVGAGGHPLDEELTGVEGGRGLRAFVERIEEVWRDERFEPRARVPLTIGGMSQSTLRLAAERASRWCSYGGEGAEPADAAERARRHNDELDRLCEQRDRDPRSLRRSIMLGYLYVHETPWRSEREFDEVVERWAGAGMEELIFVYPPRAAMPDGAVDEGVFERVMQRGVSARAPRST
jgi:alkanesulfonate monooxygenase SsuD/methylene tetrahydromethanopterin reductase-like flavin-dependent oxidoreductase (luciferase family)